MLNLGMELQSLQQRRTERSEYTVENKVKNNSTEQKKTYENLQLVTTWLQVLPDLLII